MAEIESTYSMLLQNGRYDTDVSHFGDGSPGPSESRSRFVLNRGRSSKFHRLKTKLKQLQQAQTLSVQR